MPIKRITAKHNYTMIPNIGLEDTSLSAKSKGLLAYMLSKSNDWIFYQRELETHFTDGKASINSAMKELVKHGYITKEKRTRNKLGQLQEPNWVVYDYPISENREQGKSPVNQQSKNENVDITAFPPKPDSPTLGYPTLENRQLPITDLTNTETKQITDNTNSSYLYSGELLYSGSTETAENNNKNQSVSKYEDPITLYRENSQFMPPDTISQLLDWISDFKQLSGDENIAFGIVSVAVHQALDANALNIGYIRTILLNWRDKKVSTVEMATKAINEHQQAYKNKAGKSSPKEQTFLQRNSNIDYEKMDAFLYNTEVK